MFTPEELALLKTVERSKVWRLIRDSLCLERERLFSQKPESSNDLWRQRGAIEQVNRLLHQAPYLAVYYDRHVRAQKEDSTIFVGGVPTVGERPDMAE